MEGLIIGFIKNFLLKYLSTIAIEKILIIILGRLVKATDSDIDDEIFEAVFEKVKGE